jgi:hypothetical protein
LEKDELERLVGGQLRLTFEDILDHPQLPAARGAYLKAFLEVYDGDPFLVRLLLEAGRFLVFISAAVLDAAQDLSRRETWFTVSALKEVLATYGFASGRHVDHLVRRLRDVGFLEQRQAPADRRVQLLSATEKLWSHHSKWLAAHYVPLATLFPNHDYSAILSHDRAFHVLHCRNGPAFVPVSARLMTTLPDTMLFFNYAAGPLIQNTVLKAAMDSGNPHAAVPYMEATARFGVSPTHVRRLMKSAQSAGLVRLVGRGGHEIEILPRFWTSFDRGLAVGMYLHDANHLVDMREWAKRESQDGAPSVPVSKTG